MKQRIAKISDESKKALTDALQKLGDITCDAESIWSAEEVDIDNIAKYQDDVKRLKTASDLYLKVMDEYLSAMVVSPADLFGVDTYRTPVILKVQRDQESMRLLSEVASATSAFYDKLKRKDK
ncbi:MAG: hypothetical protein IKI58_01105 [Oscillospiraceae bacterium]|nr:hypothetical protein [Oscillospiraceae bacterium]